MQPILSIPNDVERFQITRVLELIQRLDVTSQMAATFPLRLWGRIVADIGCLRQDLYRNVVSLEADLEQIDRCRLYFDTRPQLLEFFRNEVENIYPSNGARSA